MEDKQSIENIIKKLVKDMIDEIDEIEKKKEIDDLMNEIKKLLPILVSNEVKKHIYFIATTILEKIKEPDPKEDN